MKLIMKRIPVFSIVKMIETAASLGDAWLKK